MSLEIVEIDSPIPKGYLLRKIDAAVGFNRLYNIVKQLYCKDNDRPSIDPVMLFKMVLIQHCTDYRPCGRTVEEVSLNNAYQWFSGYCLQEGTLHFSLQFPAPLHGGDGRREVSVDSGGSGESGIFVTQSGMCRQRQCQHEKAGQDPDPSGIQAIMPRN